MDKPRTPGMAVLYRISTGERFERWPVDAREMMATGDYTTQSPDGPEAPAEAPTEAPTDPVPHVTQAEALNKAATAPGTAANPDAPAPADAPAEPAPEWTGKMSPENYIKRFPEGPKADLAKRVLGIE